MISTLLIKLIFSKLSYRFCVANTAFLATFIRYKLTNDALCDADDGSRLAGESFKVTVKVLQSYVESFWFLFRFWKVACKALK